MPLQRDKNETVPRKKRRFGIDPATADGSLLAQAGGDRPQTPPSPRSASQRFRAWPSAAQRTSSFPWRIPKLSALRAGGTRAKAALSMLGNS
jgi:hypothetical protein